MLEFWSSGVLEWRGHGVQESVERWKDRSHFRPSLFMLCSIFGDEKDSWGQIQLSTPGVIFVIPIQVLFSIFCDEKDSWQEGMDLG